MRLTQQETIEKLCRLVTLAADNMPDTRLHDCFCGDNAAATNPQIDDSVLEFIETAVIHYIDRIELELD